MNAETGSPKDKVVDLMAALEASVAAAKAARERFRAEREAAQVDGSAGSLTEGNQAPGVQRGE